MPDILIRGMEMPVEQPVTLILDPSGRVWLPDVKSSKEYMAKELPPHGDLVDRDALIDVMRMSRDYHAQNCREETLLGRYIRHVKEAPVIVQAERREG